MENEEYVDFKPILLSVWGNKKRFFVVFFVLLGVSIALIFSVPNKYRSEAVLAPAESVGAGSLSGLAGQFGGLASLAGVDVGSQTSSIDLALAVMTSRNFVMKFIENNNLLVEVMAVKGWDSRKNSLIVDESVYDVSTSKWIREAKFPQKAKPSFQEAYEQFVERLDVSRDKKTGIVTVSFEHYSPWFSKRCVELFIKDIDDEIKKREVLKAKKNISYLEKKISESNLSALQSVFYELIEDQTQTLMYAESRPEFVFNVIDVPIVPERKSSPNRMILVFVGCSISFLFSFLIALIPLGTGKWLGRV